MKKLSVFVASFAVAIATQGVIIDGYDFDAPGTLEKLSNLSRAEVDALSPDVRREYFKRTSELHSGGIVEKPGVGKGVFLLVDSTGELTDGMFARDFNILKRSLKLSPKIVKGKAVTVETAGSVMREMNANAAVFFVSNVVLPHLMVAPEEGWAIVNVGKLKEDAPPSEVLAKRITVEAIRGLGQIFGAGNCGLSMSAVTSLKDIDDLQHTGFPASAVKMCQSQMKKLGFEPKVTTSYRVACKQGWAPDPTNDVQRAIWNKVHQIPDKPLTIEFDPKKDK